MLLASLLLTALRGVLLALCCWLLPLLTGCRASLLRWGLGWLVCRLRALSGGSYLLVRRLSLDLLRLRPFLPTMLRCRRFLLNLP